LELDRKQSLLGFNKLLRIAVVLGFVLIVIGAAVRATNSGLACPDWPLCYNQLIPYFDFQIFMEWFHRLVAAGFSFLILWIGFKLYKNKFLRKEFSLQLFAVAALLVVQIVLGGLTVLKLLDPKVVSLHLINAVALYTVLLTMVTKARQVIDLEAGVRPEKLQIPSMLKFALLALPVILFLQIYLGGLVSSNHAGLACPDFPMCHGKWFPPASFLVWLQVLHRYLAFVATALVIAAALGSYTVNLPPSMRFGLRVLPGLIVLQIFLGVANVYLQLPVLVTVMHLANAMLIYSFALVSAAELRMNVASQKLVSPAVQEAF
jgi:cytochrome c oxidase assembly protein subunit 15